MVPAIIRQPADERWRGMPLFLSEKIPLAETGFGGEPESWGKILR